MLTVQLQSIQSSHIQIHVSSPKTQKPQERRFSRDIMHFYQLVTLATIALALPTPDIAMNEKALSSRAFEPEEDKAPSAAIIPKDVVRRIWLDDILKVVTPAEAFVVPLLW